MSSVTTRWQQRRQAARTRRALNQALARTSSPAMRDELLTMANNEFLLRWTGASPGAGNPSTPVRS